MLFGQKMFCVIFALIVLLALFSLAFYARCEVENVFSSILRFCERTFGFDVFLSSQPFFLLPNDDLMSVF